ncbi:MAG: type II toxin-antitoxin system RelE/ParE family toxin [Rickettsiales bacterium]|nr:type II toxin-antitoxin system RelE/ParE family toxin [Rickettsiales bacterium]
MAIKSFKHKGLKQLFLEEKSGKVAPKLQANALMILDVLEGMHEKRDLVGVAQFHPLTGDRKGTYSMHVNGNFCITFTMHGADVADVNLEDYH